MNSARSNDYGLIMPQIILSLISERFRSPSELELQVVTASPAGQRHRKLFFRGWNVRVEVTGGAALTFCKDTKSTQTEARG